MLRKISLIAALSAFMLSSAACTEHPAQTEFTLREQTRGAEELVERVTEGRGKEFKVIVTNRTEEGKDYFSLGGIEGKILLEGTNGVSVASALNLYLKEYCNCHISWCGENVALPEVLPVPTSTLTRTSPYRYRYYLNYCTFNYTMSWWDEARWQKEIDFMALNGINMPLAVTGQNSVWQRVYRRLGFTDKELESFFSGPAYFNWFWMGNLDGWGGPLPQSFMERHEALQKFILRNERVLGMTPVLPAFTGHVPPTFAAKYPDVKVRKTSWVNFPEVTILDPEEEMFDRIGEMFIQEQTKLYGTNHLYTADTFNENEPPSHDSLYLSGMSRKVFESMSRVDKDAVWIMQGWLFYHDRKFWGDNEIKALLGAVPDDRMIILDLWSERYPVWNRTSAYYGKPWIWCMLHNFGQNITMSGNLHNIATAPAEALHNPTAGNMQGIGLTMEGIEQTPMVYAMMLENVWRDTPIDINDFLHDYLRQRYGRADDNAEQAWRLMSTTLFENTLTNGGHESVITGRPSFEPNPGGTTNTKRHYDSSALLTAWDLMMRSADTLTDSDGFRYDLVDITRQAMADYASVLQQNCAKAYKAGDAERFDMSKEEFMTFLAEFDMLLSSRREFLLGRWIEAAKAMGTNPQESALYERNARNLLTLWGDKNCRISDYACRQWSGLVGKFYMPRWQRFFDCCSAALHCDERVDYEQFVEDSKAWEWQWVQGSESYPTEPVGDEIVSCRRIYDIYRSKM